MRLHGSRIRWVAGFILAVVLLAAVPLAVSTPIRLWQIGPPPVITLEDGRVLGQMTIAGWSEAFYSAVFQWSPPETFADLAGFAWPAVKGIATTFVLLAWAWLVVAGVNTPPRTHSAVYVLGVVCGCLLAILFVPSAYSVTGEAMVVSLLTYAVGITGAGWFYGQRFVRARG